MKKGQVFKNIKNLDSDRVVSISALLVSLGTLFMIFYQTNLIRIEQKASVMPSLILGYSVNDEGDDVRELLFLTNQGLGPAFIKEINIIDSSGVHKVDPYEYFSKTEAGDETTYINRIFPGRVVPANERLKVYEKRTSVNSNIVLGKYFRFPYEIDYVKRDYKNKAMIEILYENVYGDQWKIRSDKSVPELID